MCAYPNTPCKKCGKSSRTIKVGVTQTRTKKQKWFCYSCRRQFTTEITNPKAQTMNSSNVIPNEAEIE